MQESLPRPIRLHPFSIDHKLRNGPLANILNYRIRGPRRILNVDLGKRNVVLGQKLLGFPAITAPRGGVNSKFHPPSLLSCYHPASPMLPDNPQSPTTRIPHLGHTLLFFALAVLSFIASQGTVLAIAHPHPLAHAFLDQRLQLQANILTYAFTFAAAWFAFPLVWRRSFLAGIHWNAPAARPILIALGLILGFASQAVDSLLPTPKDAPIEGLFHNPSIIWILVVFGTFVAPLFEEVLFRGFLLPALAIAVDYLRLPRDLASLDAWRTSDHFSPPALVVSSVITSALFALIHAPQLGRNWPAVALLACVSLVLCAIRIRTRSVAASTLVHASYNLSVFLTLALATGGFRHLDKA